MTQSRHILPPRRPWTKRELTLLHRDYPNLPTAHVAKTIGRPVTTVYHRAQVLGLQKSIEFRAGPFSGRLRKGHAHRGITTRFQKGHVPANKGLRRPGWFRGRMRESWFKKGQRPHTWRFPIGSRRIIEGYLYEKVAEASPWTKAWKLVHRLVWERAGRGIPKGYVLAFKDGNQANVRLGNLECIARKELAHRNHWKHLPKELRDVIILRTAIKRQITMGERHGKKHRNSARPPVRYSGRSEKQDYGPGPRPGRLRGIQADHRHGESGNWLSQRRRR